MTKVIITHTTGENYKYLFKFLDNAEKYGHEFLFIHLNTECKIFNNKKKKFNKKNNLKTNLNSYLNNFQPSIAIIFGNINEFQNKIFYDLCYQKKIKILFSENLPIPGTFFIVDNWEYGFLDSFKNLKYNFLKAQKNQYYERGKRIFKQVQKELPKRHNIGIKSWITKTFQIKYNNLENKNKKLLILGPDSTHLGLNTGKNKFKKTFFPYFENLGEMINQLSKINNTEVWFKFHPADLEIPEYYTRYNKTNIKYFKNDVDPNILIKNCDVVISCLSKLEINIMALNKPLIYAGKGFLTNSGVGYYCKNKDEFINKTKYLLDKKVKSKKYDNLFILLGWMENQYINLYDYISKRQNTNNEYQLVKFLKILQVDIVNKHNFKNSFSKTRRDLYVKKNKLIFELNLTGKIRKIINKITIKFFQKLF